MLYEPGLNVGQCVPHSGSDLDVFGTGPEVAHLRQLASRHREHLSQDFWRYQGFHRLISHSHSPCSWAWQSLMAVAVLSVVVMVVPISPGSATWDVDGCETAPVALPFSFPFPQIVGGTLGRAGIAAAQTNVPPRVEKLFEFVALISLGERSTQAEEQDKIIL